LRSARCCHEQPDFSCWRLRIINSNQWLMVTRLFGAGMWKPNKTASRHRRPSFTQSYLMAKDKTIRKYVNSFSQTITVSVRELTWGEWIKSLSSEIDAVKAVVVSFSGAVVAILGWFGISSFRRKEKVARSHVRKQEQSEAL
jgi:hypothetical protein